MAVQPSALQRQKSKTVGVYTYLPRQRCHCLSWRWFQGRIFPFAFRVAAPSALLACLVKVFEQRLAVNEDMSKLAQLNGSAFSAFSLLVSFVVVFRTSQAHQRFSQGVSQMYDMLADWTDAVSSLIAFSNFPGTTSQDSQIFRHSIVRMVSLLNALMLAELAVDDDSLVEGRAFEFELLDVEGFDACSLSKLRGTSKKTEMVFHWLQVTIVENIPTGLSGIPAPILSRAFQMMGSGIQHFHQCKQLTQVPWPFPYTQTAECLLIMHWIVTPLCMGAWTNSSLWAGLFTFIQVFVCWALNNIAVELENPFDGGTEDVDLASIQKSLNETLLVLVHPHANSPPKGKICEGFERQTSQQRCCGSLMDVISSPLGDEVSSQAASMNCIRGAERNGGKQVCSAKVAAQAPKEISDLPRLLASVGSAAARASPAVPASAAGARAPPRLSPVLPSSEEKRRDEPPQMMNSKPVEMLRGHVHAPRERSTGKEDSAGVVEGVGARPKIGPRTELQRISPKSGVGRAHLEASSAPAFARGTEPQVLPV